MSSIKSSPAAAAPLKRKADEGETSASSPASSAKKPKTNASITSFFSAPKAKPKPAPDTSSAPSSSAAAPEEPAPRPFDKDAWAATLTPEQRSLLALELTSLDESWLAALKSDLLHPSFLSLKRFLATEATAKTKIFPPPSDIYSWSRHTPLASVRVVILGQDPYHNDNQAHGLCFSVRPPTRAPPSLKNMFVALRRDYPDDDAFKPPRNGLGLLTPWADSGVLLLNTCLTVRAHQANSHAGKGWERFTQRVVEEVAKRRTKGVVFMAWGKPAQARCKDVGKAGRHLVLQSVHPSPLSAHKGFFECGHFKKANEWLEGRYGKEGVIDWNLDVDPDKAGV